jgi:hypothetical protein
VRLHFPMPPRMLWASQITMQDGSEQTSARAGMFDTFSAGGPHEPSACRETFFVAQSPQHPR